MNQEVIRRHNSKPEGLNPGITNIRPPLGRRSEIQQCVATGEAETLDQNGNSKGLRHRGYRTISGIIRVR